MGVAARRISPANPRHAGSKTFIHSSNWKKRQGTSSTKIAWTLVVDRPCAAPDRRSARPDRSARPCAALLSSCRNCCRRPCAAWRRDRVPRVRAVGPVEERRIRSVPAGIASRMDCHVGASASCMSMPTSAKHELGQLGDGSAGLVAGDGRAGKGIASRRPFRGCRRRPPPSQLRPASPQPSPGSTRIGAGRPGSRRRSMGDRLEWAICAVAGPQVIDDALAVHGVHHRLTHFLVGKAAAVGLLMREVLDRVSQRAVDQCSFRLASARCCPPPSSGQHVGIGVAGLQGDHAHRRFGHHLLAQEVNIRASHGSESSNASSLSQLRLHCHSVNFARSRADWIGADSRRRRPLPAGARRWTIGNSAPGVPKKRHWARPC